jgi:hypothetical protein
MIVLAKLRFCGQVLSMGDEIYPKMAIQARIPRGKLRLTQEGLIEKNFKESRIKWKGIRAIARERERWNILCK